MRWLRPRRGVKQGAGSGNQRRHAQLGCEACRSPGGGDCFIGPVVGEQRAGEPVLTAGGQGAGTDRLFERDGGGQRRRGLLGPAGGEERQAAEPVGGTEAGLTPGGDDQLTAIRLDRRQQPRCRAGRRGVGTGLAQRGDCRRICASRLQCPMPVGNERPEMGIATLGVTRFGGDHAAHRPECGEGRRIGEGVDAPLDVGQRPLEVGQIPSEEDALAGVAGGVDAHVTAEGPLPLDLLAGGLPFAAHHRPHAAPPGDVGGVDP